MQKAINRLAITLWIITPIFALVAEPSPNRNPLDIRSMDNGYFLNIDERNLEGLNVEPTAISTLQVFMICEDAMHTENSDGTKELAEFMCRMMQDMAYTQNEYHNYFIRYFTEEKSEEGLYYLGGYSVTGCDISELDRNDFADYIYSFGAKNSDNEQAMRESFFWNLEKIVKPYCDEMKDASIEFHLDENDDRRRT